MTEYATTNQLMKVEKPKDLAIRDKTLIVLDHYNQIHIKGLCIIPPFLGDISRITLRGDLLYIISKDTTIAIVNILDMSIVGVCNNINELVKDVIFGNRHIHIITKNLLCYILTYENVNLKRFEENNSKTLEQLNKLSTIQSNDSINDRLRLCKFLSVSSKDESTVYVDVYGTVYHNNESILSLFEQVKYIYTTSEELFIIIDTTLVKFDLVNRCIIDKMEIGEVKCGAGPYVVICNNIVNIMDMSQVCLLFQFENILFLNGVLCGLTSEGVYEISL